MRRSYRKWSRSAIVAVMGLTACVEQPMTLPRDPVVPGVDRPGTPAAALAALDCAVAVRARRVTCSPPEASGPNGADPLIVGGQGQHVQLTSANIMVADSPGVYLSFEVDVNVQNLIPQALGTRDGAAPDSNGVEVFFHQLPTATVGSGDITIENATGLSTFLSADQPYFRYSGSELGGDGILSQNETSTDKTWQFRVHDSVLNFAFRVYVAAAVEFEDGWVDVTPPADTLLLGTSQVLSATVRNAVGNVIAGAPPVTWGTSDSGVAIVDAAGNVTGVSAGAATITATSGVRSGSAQVQICPSLALGSAYVADMPGGANICLGAGPGGTASEYTIIPVNDTASVSLSVTGSGIVPVTGAPTPSLIASGAMKRVSAGGELQRDDDFETALRTREREQLRNKRPLTRFEMRMRQSALRGNVPGGISAAITPGLPAVGALMSLNVDTNTLCSTSDTRTGRVMAVGTRVIVIADTSNPAGGFTPGDYQAIADTFDTKIYPVMAANFGTPADIDGNGRVIAFFTRAVNELTPVGSGSFVGGFFFARDLFASAGCPSSNVGEMFYMLAADPAGEVNGNIRSVSFVQSITPGTLAHEFQHLINASRRIYVNTPWSGELEETFMEEGLSHIAEELMFYQGAGLSPRMNVGLAHLVNATAVEAFFKYGEANFGRLREWLLAPHTDGPFSTNDNLATRGVSWAFLRYAADQSGGTEQTTWQALVNTQRIGRANLSAVFGPVESLYRRFSAAVYADDAGISAAPLYTQPSWNFRSIYSGLDYDPGPSCTCAYELMTRNPANGVADSFTLAGGGAAAYLRIGVASNAFAAIKIRSGGAPPPSVVKVVIVRRK